MEAGVKKEDIFTVTGDVTVKEDVQRIMDATIEYYGKLDVLVNNAGATRKRNMETCEIEDLDWCFNVLVRSVFMMTKAATPHLEKTKGAIINMSSLAGLRPLHYAVPYSMCKGMVDRFAQIASVGLGAKGIRVNCVNPAAVKTDMFNKKDGPGGTPEAAQKYLDWCCKAIPLGRIGEIEEVARLVTFLASPPAKFITGTLFLIDGSYSNTSYIPKPRS